MTTKKRTSVNISKDLHLAAKGKLLRLLTEGKISGSQANFSWLVETLVRVWLQREDK